MVAGMAEAGQSCDESLHGEEEGRPHQDVFWQRFDPWGSASCRWDVDLDGFVIHIFGYQDDIMIMS
jgi:hypothetical protein